MKGLPALQAASQTGSPGPLLIPLPAESARQGEFQMGHRAAPEGFADGT